MAAPDAKKVTSLDIRGTEIAVSLTPDGWFRATLDGHTLTAETYAKLRDKLMAHTKRVTAKVSIPALLARSIRYSEGIELVPITLTGIHAKDDDVLIRYDENGRADRLSSYSARQDVLKPLLAEQKVEYLRLYQAERAASKAFEEFKAKHKLDPKAVVNAAIAEATKAEEPA